MLTTWMLAAAAGLTAGAETSENWHADYGVALAETKQDNQPLLVVFDVPGDEAKRFDPALLSAEAGIAPLDSYALCHIDASTEYGKKVAEGFKVTEFPHVAVIDKTGSVILRRIRGEVSKDQWEVLLTQHQNGERVGRTRYTVAKPVVNASTPVTVSSPVVTPTTYTQPVSQPVYQPMPQVIQYQQPTQSYCPNCQRR